MYTQENKHLVVLFNSGDTIQGMFIDKAYNIGLTKVLEEMHIQPYKNTEKLSTYMQNKDNTPTIYEFIKKSCLDSEQTDMFFCEKNQLEDMLNYIEQKVS